MTPDPRLVEALAEAMDAADPGIDSDDSYAQEDHDEHLNYAAALLPAFLADPRTVAVFTERLYAVVDEGGWPKSAVGLRPFVAAILGVEPGGAS